MTEPLAFVTGTSSGVGAETASLLVSRGWRVIGVARRPVKLESALYEHLSLDLGDPDALEECFDDALAARLRLGARPRLGLVNNAASLAPVGALTSLRPGDLIRALAVNVAAPAWLSGWLIRQAGSVPLTIVDLSSGAAHKPYPGWGAYCASKAALRMIGQTLETELDEVPSLQPRRPVRIVSFAPGVVDTPMQAEVRGAKPEELPRVARFHELHAKGELVPPAGPAQAIADYLQAEELGPWTEARYEG